MPEVIIDDVNGKTFDIDDNIDNWCNYIISTFNDKKKYEALCLSSYNEYITRLNWDYGIGIVLNKLKSML